jgi:hypothetical protein
VLQERARVTLSEKLGLFSKALLTGMMPRSAAGNLRNLDGAAMQSLATASELLLEHGVSA